MERGKLVLVDVRPKGRHEEAHPPGSVNAQLYRKVRCFQTCKLVQQGEPRPGPAFMTPKLDV